MKIFGILRGFPGLGRVVSGMGILQTLQKMGHTVKVYTYLQGIEVVRNSNIDLMLDRQPDKQHVMVVGLNPISDVGGEVFEIIINEKPDLVIIDGEALMVSTLSLVYPPEKIVALLNPTDIFNESLPASTMTFYQHHYLSGKYAIVHGLNLIDKKKEFIKGCEVNYLNTILRNEILELKLKYNKKRIVGILGGGCSNSSYSFFDSTIKIGRKIHEIAQRMSDIQFEIFCNDDIVRKRLEEDNKLENISLISKFTNPSIMYQNCCCVLCRAGRNTISELLYLGLPALLFSTSGDFRSKEQNKNILKACQQSNSFMVNANLNEDADTLVNTIKMLCTKEFIQNDFCPGNSDAIKLILNILGVS